MSAAERAVVRWAGQLAAVHRANLTTHSASVGWRYHSVAELLLECGRLFTPGPPVGPLGVVKECFANASRRCDIHGDEVYVEGLASGAAVEGLVLEHAWCAAGWGAVDPTWPDGRAYLGVAFDDEYRRRRQRDHGYWSLLWAPSVIDLLRDGLPATVVREVGRPLPLDVATLAGVVAGFDQP